MAFLIPWIQQKFTDDNGQPVPGGKLYTYAAGTTTPRATYTDKEATVPNTNPIILDANGEADIFMSSGFYKFVLTDADDVELWTKDDIGLPSGAAEGIPDGGAEGAVLSKLSATSQDADWIQYGYTGYSARFGVAWSSISLDDTLAQILNITYTAPLISLSASGSSTIREKGTAVTASTLTATITKRSDPIAQVRFYKGATLLDTQSSGGGIPNGGTSTYAWSGSFSDDTSFSAQVDDSGATGGPTTVTSNTVTFSFVYPYYSGVGISGLSAGTIAGMTKDVRVSTASLLKTYSVISNGSVFYFAYPASYGALTSILDQNGFETFSDWTLRTENITGLDGNAVSYRIYEFENPVVAGTYDYTFIR